jgi:hypothetical protein
MNDSRRRAAQRAAKTAAGRVRDERQSSRFDPPRPDLRAVSDRSDGTVAAGAEGVSGEACSAGGLAGIVSFAGAELAGDEVSRTAVSSLTGSRRIPVAAGSGALASASPEVPGGVYQE